MTQGSQVLGQILVRIQESVAKGLQPLVIFDLDSTLFDVSHRTQAILVDFSSQDAHRELYPASIELLAKLRVDPRDWGIKTAIIRGGLHTHSMEFLEAVRRYWIERFFSGDFLEHDRPLPGAVDFAKKVDELGARVVYLTGRDRASMEEASKMVLATHGFPAADLVMKSAKGSDDVQFKVDWFTQQSLTEYSPIFFFENEPANLIGVLAKHPEIEAVFVDSTHSGKAQASGAWPHIRDFVTGEN